MSENEFTIEDFHESVGGNLPNFELSQDYHFTILTCFRKIVLDNWIRECNQMPPVILDTVFSGDIKTLLTSLTSEIDKQIKNKKFYPILINNDDFLNFLRSLKIVAETNPHVANYETFGTLILNNMLVFLKDQIISESMVVDDDANLITPTPSSKVVATLEFSNHMIDDVTTTFFNADDAHGIEKFKELSKLVKSELRNFITLIYKTIVYMKNIDFITIQDGNGIYNNNALPEEKNEYNFQASPIVQAVSKDINLDTWLDDMFYFMAYNFLPHANQGICVESFCADSNANTVNSFKFPDGVYTHKQSLNILTNLMLDLCIR